MLNPAPFTSTCKSLRPSSSLPFGNTFWRVTSLWTRCDTSGRTAYCWVSMSIITHRNISGYLFFTSNWTWLKIGLKLSQNGKTSQGSKSLSVIAWSLFLCRDSTAKWEIRLWIVNLFHPQVRNMQECSCYTNSVKVDASTTLCKNWTKSQSKLLWMWKVTLTSPVSAT